MRRAKKTAGRRLADWLHENEMTQTELAEALEVSQPSVSKWIRGRDKPGRGFAERISYKTGIPVEAWGA